jgi:hypothetical protein
VTAIENAWIVAQLVYVKSLERGGFIENDDIRENAFQLDRLTLA